MAFKSRVVIIITQNNVVTLNKINMNWNQIKFKIILRLFRKQQFSFSLNVQKIENV